MAAKLRNLPKRNSTPAAQAAKVTIRRNVLDEIGAEQCQVLDAFAGDGNMFRSVWSDAASYVGCDKIFYSDDRPAYVVDNLRLLRAIDLAPFNIFDLDAYGSPWEQLYIIAHRRVLLRGETIGIVLTEGQGMKLKMGGMSLGLAKLSGLNHYMPGLGKAQGEVINRAIRRVADIMGGTVTRRWEATGKVGSSIRYIGLVLSWEAA